MAKSGTCAKTLELKGDVIRYSWLLTSDSVTGVADGDTLTFVPVIEGG